MDEHGNVTLEYLFGTPFKDIQLYTGDVYGLSKYKVTNIKVRDHDKIKNHRNFPLFLIISMLDLYVDYQGSKPNDTITLSYTELHNLLIYTLVDTIYDNGKVREAVIKF